MTERQARATIIDVASLAGVSIATVSRVINATAPVAPDTVARVQAAINKLDYRPRSAAQMLASRRTNAIGILFTHIGGDFFTPLLRGIEAEAREEGFSLLIYTSHEKIKNGHNIPRPLGDHNTDGVMVFVDSLPDRELRRFEKIGFPTVLVYRSSPKGLSIPSITIENKDGARKLFDHLIEVHDYRRIAFLTGEEGHEDSLWREKGYYESLAAHGIPFDPALVAEGGFARAQAQCAVENWLAEGVEIDAIFTGDDEAAMGVLTALHRVGKRVPEDVAVVGFDDVALAQYLTPPLTTVRAPIEKVGRMAIRQLVKLIRGETADPVTLLPTKLVIRRSCGCLNS